MPKLNKSGDMATSLEVIDITDLDGSILLVTFNNGEKRLFDVTSLLNKGSAFTPLSEERIRKTAKVTFGFVSWLDGEIDVAPETMYVESFKYDCPET